MIENLFTSSPSVWTALIGATIALPIVIHLINRLQHRRVEWAAMEFLLLSYKRNRNWIWLKQLLLLVSRIAVLLSALLLLADVGCQENRMARLLGGGTTHHYVLLDDSFSMADQGSDGPAFDHARETLSLIAARMKNRPSQRFTLVRYSASRISNDENPPGEQLGHSELGDRNLFADLDAVRVDDQFETQLRRLQSAWQVSNLSVSIENALQKVHRLISLKKDENAIVYLLSDFRQHEWQNQESVFSELASIYRMGAAVELVRCVTAVNTNLVITSLEPSGHVRVAGIPLMMSITVKNVSSKSVVNVQVKLSSLSFAIERAASKSSAHRSSIKSEELPAIFIKEIEAGGSATRQFPVYFSAAGQQVIVADLPDDAIEIDNRRWCVVETRASTKVLLIESPADHQSRFVQLGLNPNRLTGIQPELRPKEFLRDVNLERLREYDVIFLLDIDTLDEAAVQNLTAFVTDGGGLAIFAGPNTNFEFYNRTLYQNGTGILPMPLLKSIEVSELLSEKIADIVPDPQSILAPPIGSKSSLLEWVQVRNMIVPPIEWSAAKFPDVNLLATLRGDSRQPLVIEKRSGAGTVIQVTTSAGPVWNNWSRNATFPPTLLLMQDHLAAGRYPQEIHLAGQPIQIQLPADHFLPEAEFEMISSESNSASMESMSTGQLVFASDNLQTGILSTILGRFVPTLRAHETDEPGIYDVRLRTTDSKREVRRFAINVDPAESRLALISSQELLGNLSAIHPTLTNWDQFSAEPKQQQNLSLKRMLLLLLLGLLICEQALSYLLSYHR